MSVYYIRAPEVGLVKIGHAVDVPNRFSTIQCHSPVSLAILATEDGCAEVEAERHSQFEPLWVRGEWFRYEGELVDFIATLTPYARRRSRKALPGALGEWLTENDCTLREFAAKIGRSQATVSVILKTGRCPFRVALEIEKVTDRHVNAATLCALVGVVREMSA